MGRCLGRWYSQDKICDSFAISLTVPKKFHSEVSVFAPANHRDFYGHGSWFLRNGNSQGEIGSRIQRDIAAYPAAGRREVEQDSFSGAGIALDTRRIDDRQRGCIGIISIAEPTCTYRYWQGKLDFLISSLLKKSASVVLASEASST